MAVVMTEVVRAVAYTRFSSDMQREESIEAQLRAIEEFSTKQGFELIATYADRGISGTTDNRPDFQCMIEDAKQGNFDVVLVHKLDRFARNRADSAIYRKELAKNNVKLISVLENFDDTPEGVILQSVIEGYNEYYSKNLRREVMKGLKENALSCRHTGGTPCLGYDVDRSSMKLVINEFEAEAVRLIFKMYIDGAGYTSIIDELNHRGFKTKRGAAFGKNSLYEILRNEKYSGVYVYNKAAAKDSNGKYNRHKSKSEADIIRIDGGVPQIISKEDFDIVQKKMAERRKRTAAFKARHEYLLSGKIVCGECGSSYAGMARKANDSHPLYISYRCTKKNGAVKCSNPEVQRDLIESLVLQKLADSVFDEAVLPELLSKYNSYAASKNTSLQAEINGLKNRMTAVDKGIENIVNVVMNTGSAALSEKLSGLEKERETLRQALRKAEQQQKNMGINKCQLRSAFRVAKQMMKDGTLANKKAIINQYVNKVIVFKDKIEVEYNISPSYAAKEDILR